jgi:hypothetical protein
MDSHERSRAYIEKAGIGRNQTIDVGGENAAFFSSF